MNNRIKLQKKVNPMQITSKVSQCIQFCNNFVQFRSVNDMYEQLFGHGKECHLNEQG